MLLMVTASCATLAQSPTPDPDTLKNPVKQIDPAVTQLPPGMHYVDEMVRINAVELPAAVLDSLKKIEPTAWEKSVVYSDKKKNIFVVEVRGHEKEITYRFSKDGTRLKALDKKE